MAIHEWIAKGAVSDDIAKQRGYIELIRCKDCKYGQYEEWDNGKRPYKIVYCYGYGRHKPDWFCADGERSE